MPADRPGDRQRNGRVRVPEGRDVRVPVPGAELDGRLVVPVRPRGTVLVAPGGRTRHGLRNRRVATGLQAAGYATLGFELLTDAEEARDARTGELRFDLRLLSARLTAVVDWVVTAGLVPGTPLALFGAGTGAAAALVTAADRPERVRAVVSRGGRPDLAVTALGRVRAPTLLVVGGADRRVLTLNRAAAARLGGEHAVAVVAGATHLFPEPGALGQVITLTRRWLDRWLTAPPG